MGTTAKPITTTTSPDPTNHLRCPYCRATRARCATTSSTRTVTECGTCERVISERHSLSHQLFHLRAHDNPLCVVTPDLPIPNPNPNPNPNPDDDPFLSPGFISTFSTFSLEPVPVFARSSFSFAGHLAELERVFEAATTDPAGPVVAVDHLRAYVQILEVSSILDLDCDISDHAFQLFRDCSSTTCLRNRSVEALATAALVQAIREAQEPRTLQEISVAASLPQKEIGKYIKILGEALKLSQPINSNSISVHMPRFCTLLQLNKSAQELAAHIGEVVVNKCFCTRRNPISISAAAIYLACQLEDKRKTQAEICKVTGLTEVTLRKVYKELLENWDDLLPANYTPAVPPEKAFPMTAIPSGRSSTIKTEAVDHSSLKIPQDKERQQDILKQTFWQTQVRSGGHMMQIDGRKEKGDQCVMITDTRTNPSNSELKVDNRSNAFPGAARTSLPPSSGSGSNPWPFHSKPVFSATAHTQLGQTSQSSSVDGVGKNMGKVTKPVDSQL